MPRHAEKKFMPFTQEQLFDLVVDVEKYPQFLPWCVGARIRHHSETEIVADLIIGFKIYRERFTSRVALSRPDRIETHFTDGPFDYLKNQWVFTPVTGGCSVDFHIDFEFKSKIFQKIISVFFNEAVRRMVAAFEGRARKLYGQAGSVALGRQAPHRA